ncbi:Fasciclin domain-containing protein [Cephalotus follicularis]|uniref:Fasciclin domain-containing protein n=1 Tax=Cephalotus follicularis TaxID=3775 RepID=A0A1Q3CGU4_CEPFO|nr:Fasciclin domain-containing protein [Cephalotus follicularis]
MLEASEILWKSGFISMALTLEFGSQMTQTIIPPSPSLTIFSPSDHTFALSGQPSLSLLQFHFSPQYFPLQTLKSLPSGTHIPTFFSNHPLIVTTSPSTYKISINGVKINETPIYDNGSLLIFGIDKFLDPSFRFVPEPGIGCVMLVNLEVLMLFLLLSSFWFNVIQ